MRSSSPTLPDPGGAPRGLARRLRALRERRGWTQEDLAERAGLSVSFVSLLERGGRGPSQDTLVQVAEALGVPLVDLFREEDEGAGAHRLVDFAHARHLSRAQVDQLLAVAEQLFAGDAAPASPPPPAPPACQEPGCGRPVLARALCTAHYHRARRARLPSSS